jgi:hypothetical protein
MVCPVFSALSSGSVVAQNICLLSLHCVTFGMSRLPPGMVYVSGRRRYIPSTWIHAPLMMYSWLLPNRGLVVPWFMALTGTDKDTLCNLSDCDLIWHFVVICTHSSNCNATQMVVYIVSGCLIFFIMKFF